MLEWNFEIFYQWKIWPTTNKHVVGRNELVIQRKIAQIPGISREFGKEFHEISVCVFDMIFFSLIDTMFRLEVGRIEFHFFHLFQFIRRKFVWFMHSV